MLKILFYVYSTIKLLKFCLLMLDMLINSSIVLLNYFPFLHLIKIILAGAFATAISNVNCFKLRTQNAFIREPKEDYILFAFAH